ncbi:MAG: nucleotidyltransferase family protein [Rhodospirillales bacterium]|nr:nucleotidyltransferase family protein [Rhodospirillales bacterium]
MKTTVAAIVLAAGVSRRMGTVNKLLMGWQGKPMLRHIVETALGSRAMETIVVTGHDGDAITEVLEGLDVRIIHNPRYEEGLSTSLVTGIGEVEAKGAAILLGDMPGLKVETLNALIAAFEETEGRSICVPVCQGRRGNPVIWPREFFSDIAQLSGDKGARDLMTIFKERLLEMPCDDNGVLMDFDTIDDIPLSSSARQD